MRPIFFSVILASVSLTGFCGGKDTKPNVEVKLRNGNEVSGEVISQSDTEVVLETSNGTLRIPILTISPESMKKNFEVSSNEAKQATIVNLEAKIKALERENQELRKELAKAKGSVSPQPPIEQTQPPKSLKEGVTSQLTYSISSSGKRHNSRCRFFDKAKSCEANAGTACKICGG